MSHAPRSPSARHRWGACAASARAEAQYPEEPSGPAAVDGTHTHTLLEACVPGLIDPRSLVGQKMTDHEGDFTVDVARAERAKVAIDYIGSRCGGETTIRAEWKVDPVHLVGRSDCSGTVDVMIERHEVWELIDYKDGGGVVTVEENPQLLQYGTAVVSEAIAAQRKLPDLFRLTIVQPKLAERGLPAVTSWEVPTTRLIEEANVIRAQADACDDPNAPFTPGETQCKYCRHRNNCKAKAEKVMADMGMMFQSTDKKIDFVEQPSWINDGLSKTIEEIHRQAPPALPLDIATQAANKNPSEMSNEQIRQILDAAPLMRQLLESVEEEALTRLKTGRPIPGLKLVNGRGSRSWAHPDDEMAGKLTKMGIPKGSVYVTKLVSPAQAEKLRWKKRDGTDVQLSARQLERLNTEYIIHMGGKLTVVPESDSRPAVTLDASPLFAPVVEASARPLTYDHVPGTVVNTAAPEPAADLPAWLSMSSTKE